MIKVSITLLPPLVFGIALGLAFFSILWFTVQRGLISAHPARWFLGGLLLRMSIAFSGFYFIANEGWLTLLICLLGFIITREFVRRLVVFKRISYPKTLNSENNNAS
jgi:F1F0 ATPase subunit 2